MARRWQGDSNHVYLTLSVSFQPIIAAAVGLRYALLLSVSVLLSRCLFVFLLRYEAAGRCCRIN